MEPSSGYAIAKDAVTGTLSAFSCTIVCNPLIYAQNALVNKKPLELKRAYKGAGSFFISLCVSQVYAKVMRGLADRYLNSRGYQITPAQDLLVSSLIGGSSTLFVSPFEYILAQAGRHNKRSLEVIKLTNQLGIRYFYKGALFTGIREMGSTAGLISLQPIVYNKLKKHFEEGAQLELVASVISGIITAAVSHPANVMSSYLKWSNGTFKEGTESLFPLGIRSWKSSFKGVVPRTLALIGAIYLFQQTNKYVPDKIDLLANKLKELKI